MNQSKAFYFLIVAFLVSCAEPSNKDSDKEPSINGPFFGVEPTNEPRLLAPKLLASLISEYNGAFNLDGTEFFYTSDYPGDAYVTYTKMNSDGTWSQPAIAPFSADFPEYDPLFSPDGSKLYFSSQRPIGDNNLSKIMVVQRNENGWGEAEYIPFTDTLGEYYSSVTRSGVIYFNIWSTGDLFKAIPTDTGYQVEELKGVFDTDYGKGDPFISPDEDYLIFRGYREDSFGNGDLYISFNIEDEWTQPKNLGKPINSEAHETCPSVTLDGKLFIFASRRVNEKPVTQAGDPIAFVHENYKTSDNGSQNIYYMSASFIDRMKKELDQ